MLNISDRHFQIILAIIGSLGAIIAAIIGGLFLLKVKTVEISLTNIETKQGITGKVFIDAEQDGKPSYPEKPAVLELRRKNLLIRAESEGYKTEIVAVKNITRSYIIEMKKIKCGQEAELIPLSFNGWFFWSGIALTGGTAANECVLNSNGRIPATTGINNTGLNFLRDKTLVMYFSNTEASKFSQSRMVKITYNINDTILRPLNASLLFDEYLPVEDTPLDRGIEFTIPDDFDGKLSFVFYQAELNGLKITAYYK
jgi:hypothetical protein